MSDLIVPNIICIQAQKEPNTINNTGILRKGVFTDLFAGNFVHARTSLSARCVHLVTVRVIYRAQKFK